MNHHAVPNVPVRPDPAMLARAQRVTMRLAGLSLGLMLAKVGLAAMMGGLPGWMASMLMLAQVGAWAGLVWGVWNLCQASGLSKQSGLIHAALMLLPIVNLGVVVVANLRAVKQLQEMGIRAGFLGVRHSELAALSKAACAGCGYKSRGVASGQCPECGKGLEMRRAA